MLEYEYRYKLEAEEFIQLAEELDWSSPIVVEDITFGHHGMSSMSVDGWVVRVRSQGDLNYLQFKGRASGVSTNEHSLQIDDRCEAIALLQAIGLTPGLIIRRTRRQARLEDTILSLDDVLLLGHFLEVESTRMNSGGCGSVILGKLGLSERPAQPMYGDLLLSQFAIEPAFAARHAAALTSALRAEA